MKKILSILYLTTCFLLTAQVNLNFYSSNNDPERKAVIRYLFNAFELYNPDIKVNLLPFEDSYSTEEISVGKNGLLPHMIMADSLLLSRLSNKSLINQELTSRILMDIGIEDFYTGGLKAFNLTEGYYGIPYSAWLQVIWYRNDWFESEGLEPPYNITSLLKAGEYFKNLHEGVHGNIVGSKNDLYTMQCFLQIADSIGVEIDFDNRGCFFPKEPLIEALNIYKTLIAYTPPGENDWRTRDYYFQNRAALLFYSTHLMDDLALSEVAQNSLTDNNFPDLDGAEFSPDLLKNTGMVTTLTGTRPSSFGSISGLGLFKSEDLNIKIAQEKLVRFLFRKDVYTTWLHMSPGGMLPVRRSILAEDSFYRDSGGVFKKYGREKLIELTSGLEFLNIINPECLKNTIENQYNDNDFQNLIYHLLNSEDINTLIEPVVWIR
ncbi:MAG: carbohydrate ABC transporter substrate-binding protein [Spirochaetales bacterium]|nr:carbohydrate ABC transporter substrate-binding protein [Spirochaetales bacterium]